MNIRGAKCDLRVTYIYGSDTNLDQHDILGMMEVGDSSFLYKVRVSLYYKNYSSIYNHQNVLEKCFMKIKCFKIKHNSVDHRWNLRLLKILWDFQKWECRGLMGARIYIELRIGPWETYDRSFSKWTKFHQDAIFEDS